MFTETQKLHLIEEVLKTHNVAILTELETIINRAGKTGAIKHFSASDFTGRWSTKEADLIEKAIEEGCEQINADDWK